MPNYIQITWSGIRRYPNDDLRKKIENMAAGVVLTHSSGVFTPKKAERTEEITSYRKFDPTISDEGENCEYKSKIVKDLLIEILIEEEPSFLLEVFYVWSTHIENNKGKKKVKATDRYYEILISELEVSVYDIENE